MRNDYSSWRGKERQFKQMLDLIAAHGDSDECLIWPFTRRPDGYGTVYYDKHRWRVTRLTLKLLNGKLYRHLEVLHSCDNPPCFNPKHLFQGTQADNMADMDRKGRRVNCAGPNPLNAGENNGNGKLTEDKVLEIRRRWQSGEQQKDIAADIGISKMNVSLIVRGLAWKHALL